MIYLDNAATTPMFDCAKQSMIDIINTSFANPSTIYDIGENARNIIEDARSTIADIINAKPGEIYFTSGGSEGNNTVIKGSKARHIITDSIEHKSVTRACEELEKGHTWITEVDVKQTGIVDLDQIKFWQNKMTDLISVMYVNNETGIVQPIAELNKYKGKAYLHTDAVQAVGHFPIDVKKLGVDFLTASAHKFGGPKGIGFLYMRTGAKYNNNGENFTPLIAGGDQENGYRAGTENVSAIVGMSKALQFCRENDYFVEHIKKLAEELRLGIKDFAEINVENSDEFQSVFSIFLPSVSGERMMMALNDMSIYVSTGSACNSGEQEPSYVLTAMGLPFEVSSQTIRVSLGVRNTVEQIRDFVEALKYNYKLLKG